MMQVMGMRHSVGWLVWLLVSLAGMVLISVLVTLLMKYGGLLVRS